MARIKTLSESEGTQMLTQSPKGTRDILPNEVYKWQYVEKVVNDICKCFGCKEIRIPVFEHTELFKRGVGDTTDIVQKEMYTFIDKDGKSLSLRPEGTAGVVRSYIQNGMSSLPQPVKLYYMITAYRRENVQKGRYREFHQFGVEIFGADKPETDVEVISMLDTLFSTLGLKSVKLNMNSIGCPECRANYNANLKDYIRPHLNVLCQNCQSRFERNPLRIIDCKEEACRVITANAPALLDYLCDECSEHFKKTLRGLDNLGIQYSIDKRIVRGLDYYTKTVFEYVSENVGTQGTICGGGRYDGLVEACGGPKVPAVGFGLGIERLLMEMESQNVYFPQPHKPRIYIASLGENAALYAQKLIYQLRKNGIYAEMDLMGRSAKAQMKHADKLEATYCIVIGDNEIESNKAVLKNMLNGEAKDICLDTIVDRLKNLHAQS